MQNMPASPAARFAVTQERDKSRGCRAIFCSPSHSGFDPSTFRLSRYWWKQSPEGNKSMKNSNPPNLTLVVQSNASSPRTWILEPQGRNTFKIVVICCPNKLLQPPTFPPMRCSSLLPISGVCSFRTHMQNVSPAGLKTLGGTPRAARQRQPTKKKAPTLKVPVRPESQSQFKRRTRSGERNTWG